MEEGKTLCEASDIGELCGLAPFLSQEVLDRLAVKACEVNGIGMLCAIAPFISKEVLNELITRTGK